MSSSTSNFVLSAITQNHGLNIAQGDSSLGANPYVAGLGLTIATGAAVTVSKNADFTYHVTEADTKTLLHGRRSNHSNGNGSGPRNPSIRIGPVHRHRIVLLEDRRQRRRAHEAATGGTAALTIDGANQVPIIRLP